MQRKTLLSACIALALSGQGWAADITEIETTTGEKKNTNVTCPADPGKLSPEELKRLPSECSSVVEQNLMPWLVTGAATALITTLAIVELNDDDDHHRNNSPLPPTPPDDDSDDTPVPPTPGGDEIIPDDGPDDTPTPPKPIAFNNDVILDKTEKTLTIRDSVFSYTENADGTISLQDSNGRKATINLWQIDETNNTVALEGMSADGATKWQYNHNVVRASIMGSLSAFSLTARRDYTAGHALALAVMAMLLYSPYLFFDLSFRLSCSASAGIVLCYKRITTILSFLPEFLRNCLSVSLSAQVLVVPLLLGAFFSFPVYSLLANVVVAPVLDLVMVLGLGASVLSLLYDAGADLILFGVKPLLALALKGNAFIAALPGSRLWAGQPSLWAWFSWYLLVGFVFFRSLRKKIFLPLIISLAVSWMMRPSGPGVLIFDAGRDQATAIIYEDRSADLWYNKSRFSNPDQAAVVVIPALRANGIFRLRRCVVEGEERAYTEALFQKAFTFLKGPGKGEIPYRGVTAVPQTFSGEPLLWELRSLDAWDGKSFPASALGTVVYEGFRGQGAAAEWGEAADSYGVPAYIPSRDGQLRLFRHRGQWRLSTFIEEDL